MALRFGGTPPAPDPSTRYEGEPNSQYFQDIQHLFVAWNLRWRSGRSWCFLIGSLALAGSRVSGRSGGLLKARPCSHAQRGGCDDRSRPRSAVDAGRAEAATAEHATPRTLSGGFAEPRGARGHAHASTSLSVTCAPTILYPRERSTVSAAARSRRRSSRTSRKAESTSSSARTAS